MENNSVKIVYFKGLPDQALVKVQLDVMIFGVTIQVPEIPIAEDLLDNVAMSQGRERGQWSNDDLKYVIGQYFNTLGQNIHI